LTTMNSYCMSIHSMGKLDGNDKGQEGLDRQERLDGSEGLKGRTS